MKSENLLVLTGPCAFWLAQLFLLEYPGRPLTILCMNENHCWVKGSQVQLRVSEGVCGGCLVWLLNICLVASQPGWSPPLPISGRYFMPLSRSGLQCVHCAPTDKDLPATCVCIYPRCCVSTISFHYHDISFVRFRDLPEHGFEYIYIISSTSLHYHEICFVRFNRQGFATKMCLHISIGLKHITSSSWGFLCPFKPRGIC